MNEKQSGKEGKMRKGVYRSRSTAPRSHFWCPGLDSNQHILANAAT